jgi:hypothetical protein
LQGKETIMKTRVTLVASLSLLVATALAYFFVQQCFTRAATPGWLQAGGVSLVVRFDPFSATILRARPLAGKTSGDYRHDATITLTSKSHYPPGSGELLAAVYDKAGKRLATFAWAPWPLVFADTVRGGGSTAFRGGPSTHQEDLRFLEIPLQENARYLAFVRTEIKGATSESAVLRVIELSVHDLAPSAADRVGTPAQVPKDLQLEPPARDLPPAGAPAEISSLLLADSAPAGEPANSVSNPSTCAPAATNDKKYFDILILGDGFANKGSGAGSCDGRSFYPCAREIEQALVGTSGRSDGVEPFHSLGWRTLPTGDEETRIVFHRDDSPWRDSPELHPWDSGGITHCWNADESECKDEIRDTYFGVEGRSLDEFETQGGPGFFRTENLDRIKGIKQQWEGRQLCSGSTVLDGKVDLVIVLANCWRYGGNADMRNDIVYLPINPSRALSVTRTWCSDASVGNRGWYSPLVAHEVAHVVAHLGEEYVSCVTPKRVEHDQFLNVAHQGDTDPGSVPWKKLAEAKGDYSAANGFKYVYTSQDAYPNGAVADKDCRPSACGEQVECDKKLGLFWGAMYGSCDCADTLVSCQSPWCAASHEHFRPMSRCKMRSPEAEFCAVCSCLIRHAILKASGEPEPEDDCPERSGTTVGD